MSSRWIGICALVALSAPGASAQEKPAQPPEKPPAAAQPRESAGPVPLRVTVVLSRYQGEKRISSLPYILGVTANSRPTTLRMGVQVPIVARSQKAGAPQMPSPAFSYRDVGTDIDCVAQTAPGGLYNLSLVVEESSVHLNAGEKPGSPPTADEIPSFRTFKSSFTALMRDGQTTQYTSATDPVSGEVMKIDLTLNVMK